MSAGEGIGALIASLPDGAALCAFNVETYDFMVSAFRAAESLQVPVVLGVSVPVAEAFGYSYLVKLGALISSEYSVPYALHLDHAETATDVLRALDAGFNSANFLNEGGLSAMEYEDQAVALRERNPDASLEFVLGTLGHASGSAHDHGDHESHAPVRYSVDDIVAFAARTRPTVLGFDMGSLHGMTRSIQDVDVDRIGEVFRRSAIPMVLHGSSGVRDESVTSAISAGVRKVNLETALRSTYMDAIRDLSVPGAPGSRKPRMLSAQSSARLEAKMTRYLEMLTRRP